MRTLIELQGCVCAGTKCLARHHVSFLVPVAHVGPMALRRSCLGRRRHANIQTKALTQLWGKKKKNRHQTCRRLRMSWIPGGGRRWWLGREQSTGRGKTEMKGCRIVTWSATTCQPHLFNWPSDCWYVASTKRCQFAGFLPVYSRRLSPLITSQMHLNRQVRPGVGRSPIWGKYRLLPAATLRGG